MLLPATALAADSGTHIPTLEIASSAPQGTQFRTGKYYCIAEDGITVSEARDTANYQLYCEIDTEDRVQLTLNGAALKAALYVPGNTTLTLIGENSIEVGTGIQVQTAGDVALTGAGSLDITASTEGLLNQNGGCTVDGVTLTINSGAYALNISGDIAVNNASYP